MKTRLVTMIAGAALIAAGILYMYPRMAPIREGTESGFWTAATGVQVGPESPYMLNGTYPPREGWCIYYDQSQHDQQPYRVREEAVLAAFPAVLPAVARAVEEGTAANCLASAYEQWERGGEAASADGLAFLVRIREARLAQLAERELRLREHALADEADFDVRWATYKRYWITAMFEFLYLTGLAAFVVWPWLRRKGSWAWAVHLGLTPVLFFLPHFLGYCWFTFTTQGPGGGVLYPWLIDPFRQCHAGWWSDADLAVLNALPKVLIPVAQPFEPWISLSFMGYVGPLTVLAIALAIAAATLALARLRGHRVRKDAASNLEVQPTTTSAS